MTSPIRARRPLEPDARSRFEFLSRMHQTVPDLCSSVLFCGQFRAVLSAATPESWVLGQQEAFHGSATWNAVAKQPRREDARVVDDKQVAGAKKRGQIRDRAMTDGARGAVEDEQPRRAARCRILRDQIVGKLEIEVGDVHAAGAPMYCGTIRASNTPWPTTRRPTSRQQRRRTRGSRLFRPRIPLRHPPRSTCRLISAPCRSRPLLSSLSS